MKQKIEIFSAGCKTCHSASNSRTSCREKPNSCALLMKRSRCAAGRGGFYHDTIATVKLAGSEHEVIVHDMHQEAIARRAAEHGLKSVPAVVINGKLAGCCAGRGVEEQVLREALR